MQRSNMKWLKHKMHLEFGEKRVVIDNANHYCYGVYELTPTGLINSNTLEFDNGVMMMLLTGEVHTIRPESYLKRKHKPPQYTRAILGVREKEIFRTVSVGDGQRWSAEYYLDDGGLYSYRAKKYVPSEKKIETLIKGKEVLAISRIMPEMYDYYAYRTENGVYDVAQWQETEDDYRRYLSNNVIQCEDIPTGRGMLYGNKAKD